MTKPGEFFCISTALVLGVAGFQMKMISGNDVAADARHLAQEVRNLRLLFGLVLAANLASSFYASIDARGLYHDGVAYLFRIAESDGFVLDYDTRTTVEILQQAPIVLLSKLTSMSLFQRGQIFTAVLLMLPTMLCALCWFIAPRDRKAWILFPVVYLLIGFAPTSMNAIGEAAIATSYFWILLFLLLFRTRSIGSQALFWLLSIPAFQLHEGAFPLTCVLLLGCALRWRAAEDLRERLFVAFSALLFAAVFTWQIRSVVYPQNPPDLAGLIQGLMQFQYLYAENHFNLPMITGTVALLALAIVFLVYSIQSPIKATFQARTIVVVWVLFAFAAVAVAILSEQSFSPFAQLQARYHPVFASAALEVVMILLLALNLPDRIWMQSATVVILISLCVAQTTADIVATRRWNAFVADLQSRLGNLRGLIPWETMLHTGDKRRDINWRLMTAIWTIPYTSIVFAPTSSIRSIIDLPVNRTDRAIDPEKPDQLPELRGIDHTPYRRFFGAQKSDASQ
jgi:hypothetical protein